MKFTKKEKYSFFYDENFLYSYYPSLYDGYFQNEKYFKNINSIITKDFTFPKLSSKDKFNQNWINEINKAKNPVFIHIRRSDYLNKKWALPISYYKKAIKYIQDHVVIQLFLYLEWTLIVSSKKN